MRKTYSILLLLLLVLSSCWWIRKRDPKPSYAISGAKWQEVKLWLYHKTYHGLIFNDTTYNRSAFDSLDYAQFFNDGNVKMASHYYYSLHDGMSNGDPSNLYFSDTRSFITWRSLYLINPTGFDADTVYYNGRDSLRIHSFRNNGLFYDEMDAYYTR